MMNWLKRRSKAAARPSAGAKPRLPFVRGSAQEGEAPVAGQARSAVASEGIKDNSAAALTLKAIVAFLASRAVPYWDMPKSVAQLTGMLVTGIVAFGTDLDITWSIPLGIFAGALAVFFVSLSEARDNLRRWERF